MSLCPSPNLVPFQVQSPPKTNTTWDRQNLELGCHENFYKICWVENVSRCDWDSDSLLRRILHSAAPGGGAHSSQCGPWAGSGAGFRLHKPAPVSRQSTGCHHHTHSLISGENRKITWEHCIICWDKFTRTWGGKKSILPGSQMRETGKWRSPRGNSAWWRKPMN